MKRLTILLLLVSLLLGCSNDCPDGLCATEACPFCPDAAVLLFPENNQACEPGEVLSETQATLTLQWQGAKDADRYSLTITDQASGETQRYDNLTSHQPHGDPNARTGLQLAGDQLQPAGQHHPELCPASVLPARGRRYKLCPLCANLTHPRVGQEHPSRGQPLLPGRLAIWMAIRSPTPSM